MSLILVRGTHTGDSTGAWTEVEHRYIGLQSDFTYNASTGLWSASTLPTVGQHMDATAADTVTEPICHHVHVDPRPVNYPGFAIAVVRGRAPKQQTIS